MCWQTVSIFITLVAESLLDGDLCKPFISSGLKKKIEDYNNCHADLSQRPPS